MTVRDLSGLPKGAVFHRCALQVNPPGYGAQFRGARDFDDPDGHVEAVVEKALDLRISALAVTGHNDPHGAVLFRRAAAKTDLVVFSGLEVESREGIHVLCIYGEEVGPEQLGRFLGAFGIHDPAPSTEPSDRSFSEIVRETERQGGLAIAAHVTQNKGLLRALSGQARANAWKTPELLAVQIPGSVSDLKMKDRPILENLNPIYHRAHPAAPGQAVSAVNCRDVVTPHDLEDPSATCLIKMAEVGIEGLRQAFLDPESRIRLNPRLPVRHPPAEMRGIEWAGGFLDGVRMRFNPNLNVLIGGRGAGKSTVIESLRYVLGLSPVGEEASGAHRGIVGDVLGSGTQVSLLVRRRQPTEQDYWIERTVSNPPVVRDASGAASNLTPGDLLPDAEVYGQHEIAELAKSPERRTTLLHRFMPDDPDSSRRRLALRDQLGQQRRSLLDTEAELADIDDRLAALPRLEEKLSQFEGTGIEHQLHERGLLAREERLLRSAAARLDPLREVVGSLGEELPVDRLFLSRAASDDLPSGDLIAKADATLTRLQDDLESVMSAFATAIESAEAGLSGIRRSWEEREERTRTRYEKTLRHLQRSGVDGEAFVRLRKDIEALGPQKERQSVLRRQLDEHRKLREELLQEWRDLNAASRKALAKAADVATQGLTGRARISVSPRGDLAPLKQLLRNRVGGRLKETLDALDSADDFSLESFVNSCRRGPDALCRDYGVPRTAARRIASAGAETLMRIDELDLPLAIDIELNTAAPDGDPDWRSMNRLSTGQKATAILLLLLLHSDGPLIVDQPEDDLDNRFITESVVPRMREAKQRRQFVFATHNANIPVLGDAELILGITPSGDATSGTATILPEHMGSIDTEMVRSVVEDLLEGGKTAFETRRRKYGF